jgi:hypothetical protein
MSDRDRLRLLRAQLDDDFSFIQDNLQRHNEMAARASRSTDDEMATMAVAYLLHNLYTALEGYFYRVAKHFENSLDDSSWHRELIDRMRIDVPGIRPALITVDMVEPLDELRRFRHLFRNLYKSRLKTERVMEISGTIAPLIQDFARCHQLFIEWLDQLIETGE